MTPQGAASAAIVLHWSDTKTFRDCSDFVFGYPCRRAVLHDALLGESRSAVTINSRRFARFRTRLAGS